MAQVQYKTPGVYVEEIDAFPPSIVGVETAVPVFIGYTERAEKSGRNMNLRPVRISSLVDYAHVFGGAPRYQFEFIPMPTQAEVNTAKGAADRAQKAADATTDAEAKAAAQAAATQAKQDADNLQKDFDNSDVGKAQKQVADLQGKWKTASDNLKTDASDANKAAETDAKKNLKDAEDAAAAADNARDNLPSVVVGGGTYGLKMDRAYYFYNSIRLFYANGGGDCYVVSVGSHDNAVTKSDLQDGLAAVADLVGPTMLVIPEAVLLEPANYATLVHDMLDQCYTQQDRVAIIDVQGSASVDSFASDIDAFRNTVAAVNSLYLKYGMAYAPFLSTSVVDPTEISFLNFSPDSNAALTMALTREADRLFPDPTFDSKNTDDGLTNSARKVKDFYTSRLNEITNLPEGDAKRQKFVQLNQMLTSQIPVFKDMYSQMAAHLSVLPASGAMAGIFTQVDASRGVWNAPANIGVTSVIGPTVPISTKMQEDLNLPITGYAVNAIRSFVGRGTLVWGARTLDGNSNDWRYIQVRRTLIYIEQSVELALNKFVFEPNVAQTWVTVSSMIGAFLRGLWSQGGLMGATPEEAFSVQCGLGSTMTAQDVLEGRMIVQIKLQMVRPAEFIVLTFKQQMQGGGA